RQTVMAAMYCFPMQTCQWSACYLYDTPRRVARFPTRAVARFGGGAHPLRCCKGQPTHGGGVFSPRRTAAWNRRQRWRTSLMPNSSKQGGLLVPHHLPSLALGQPWWSRHTSALLSQTTGCEVSLI